MYKPSIKKYWVSFQKKYSGSTPKDTPVYWLDKHYKIRDVCPDAEDLFDTLKEAMHAAEQKVIHV